MVHVVTGGSDVFDALCFGMPSVENQSFFAEQVGRTSALLSQSGQAFANSAHALYNRIVNSDAIRIAHAAVRVVQSIWDDDAIAMLSTVEQMQCAGLTMQRWIMAEPNTRALYHKQGCDGFSNSYVDHEPGLLAQAHYDWRRVMNGVIVDTEDGGWEAVTYIDDDEDEVPIGPAQLADILQTWEYAEMAVKANKGDHTSIYGASL